MRTNPDWLVLEPSSRSSSAPSQTGKEAQVDVVERTGADGHTCLLARKRYLPRTVTAKGTLEALGVQRASTFHNDVEYREGRQFRKTRDRRAVEAMTTYGKQLLQDRWTGHEYDVMTRLWEAGVSVPYPVSYGEDLFYLEYVGDSGWRRPAARRRPPRPAPARRRLGPARRGAAHHDREGFAHADLSAFNLLWWEGRLVFIDFPQAVDLAANPQGLDFLHRDVLNVAGWFARRGVERDAEALFADLLSSAWG